VLHGGAKFLARQARALHGMPVGTPCAFLQGVVNLTRVNEKMRLAAPVTPGSDANFLPQGLA
jgi:hypothetical protein